MMPASSRSQSLKSGPPLTKCRPGSTYVRPPVVLSPATIQERPQDFHKRVDIHVQESELIVILQ